MMAPHRGARLRVLVSAFGTLLIAWGVEETLRKNAYGARLSTWLRRRRECSPLHSRQATRVAPSVAVRVLHRAMNCDAKPHWCGASCRIFCSRRLNHGSQILGPIWTLCARPRGADRDRFPTKNQ